MDVLIHQMFVKQAVEFLPYCGGTKENVLKQDKSAHNVSYLSKDDGAAIARGGSVIETPDRRRTVERLIAKLEEAGWVPDGHGEAWYSYRFRRADKG
jgi:hypothetical protein